MDSKNTETTRYLCAAAHLNSNFCNQVIEQIIEEEHKAISRSYGVDSFVVVKHCLAARRRRMIRDIVLAILFVLSIFVVTSGNDLGYYSEGFEEPFYSIFIPVDFYIRYFVVSPFFVLACAIVFWESWVGRYRIVANNMLRKNLNPDFVKFEGNTTLKNRLKEIANEQNCNVIIYGGFSPFVGSGFDIGGWSFALDVNKGKEELNRTLKPLPFQVKELYNYVSKTIWELKIDGLSIEDGLYVNGEEIRDDARFLPNPLTRPHIQVTPSLLKEFVENPTPGIRHYKCIQLMSWKGELVISIFLRFANIGQNLFIEASYFLLTPLKEEYRKVDTMQPKPTLLKRLALAWESALITVFLWPFSLLISFSKIFNSFIKRRERRKNERLIKGNPTFNYGAITSIRELAASPNYRRYFQKLDKEMYLKVIERQILDRIVDFLDSKNIDTSDLKERQTAILNNGVIVSGGSVKAQSLSVGEQAKSVVASFTKTAKSQTRQTQQQ